MSTAENLKGCVIVTETEKCPAYALVLQQGSESEISLGLKLALPSALSGSPAIGFRGEWIHSGNVSIMRNAVAESNTFVPLFRLKSLQPKGKWVLKLRGKAMEKAEQAASIENSFEGELEDVLTPWDALNEDGTIYEEEY
jgi:hypothetical protein